MSKAVVVLSGGLDSSTLLHLVRQTTLDVYAISFNYGQRHEKELEYAAWQAGYVGVKEHRIVDMKSITTLFANSGSSLVTGSEVPEGHYGEENMKATVVPNRNMIMLSIAVGYGVSNSVDAVYTGVHAGDHFIYPDCRPRFIHAANAAAVLGNEGFGGIGKIAEGVELIKYIQTPFIEWSKNEIATQAVELGVPVTKTWSCYKGGKLHCGRCGTCVERIEALKHAEDACPGFMDTTEYEDENFWREALKRETV